jgi:hypothetical protein
MNSKKIVFTSLLVVTAMITLAAFAASSFDKNAFARVCYAYHGTKKRVAPGQADSIDCTEFRNTNNWVSYSSAEPPSACDAGAFVCVICFDNTEYTLQQALDFLCNLYESRVPKNFIHGEDADPSIKRLTIYLKSTSANP